jgi:hypothetical protein
MMGEGNSNALASVPGFEFKAECEDAGRQAEDLASGSVKKITWICVKQTQGAAHAKTKLEKSEAP